MSGIAKLAYSLCLISIISGCQTLPEQAPSSCTPLGYDTESLASLKLDNFRIVDMTHRQRFALELVGCLGDPDPAIRDGIAYEAYVTLLRGKQLDTGTIDQLRVALLALLASEEPDTAGFRRPFAVLTLAEVARADRIDGLFSDQQRAEIVDAATSYLAGVEDYRGYDQVEGWRHGVAHAADLLLQLILNPALTRDQLTGIAGALAVQIAPPVDHFYVYGEYERLARPVYYLAMRGELTDQQWADWFAGLASPAPFDSWGDVWTSQAGLAKLHNTKVFAETIYLYATANESEQVKPLAKGALAVLKVLN